MRAAGRERQRATRRHAKQPALGIELVEQREQVVLAGGAAVEEDQGAFGLAGRGAESVD